MNIYEIDDVIAKKKLKVKYFDKPDEEWFDFVEANRKGSYDGEQFDIIVGAIADDAVYFTLQIYWRGGCSKKEAIKNLKVKELYSQSAFVTTKAIKHLKFIGFEEVKYEGKV